MNFTPIGSRIIPSGFNVFDTSGWVLQRAWLKGSGHGGSDATASNAPGLFPSSHDLACRSSVFLLRVAAIDTSMGFTPLEGLIMGTRIGGVDAGAILHLITNECIAPSLLLRALNSASGLKGISGVSNDMRDLLREPERGRALASRG